MKKLLLSVILLLFAVNVYAFPPILPRWNNIDSTQRYFEANGDSLFATISGLSYKKFYNVKHFGAVGDSSADDRAAILSAIDAYRQDADEGGAVIYFPPGIYRLSDSIVVYTDTLPRIKFEGAGYSTKIMIEGTGGFAFDGISTANHKSAHIKDMLITLDVADTSAEYAIKMSDIALPAIDNVWIEGAGYLNDGIYFEGAQQGYIKGGYVNKCNDGLVLMHTDTGDVHSNGIHIAGVSITGTDLGGGLTRGIWYNGANTGTFIGNHITNCSTLIAIDSGAYTVNIISNHLETGFNGIVVSGSSNAYMSGNIVVTCDTTIYLKGGHSHTVFNNLFQGGNAVFGASSYKNTIMSNLFGSSTVTDSNTAFPDQINNYAFNTGQGGTTGLFQGLQFRSGSTDSSGFLMTSAGDIKHDIIGTDSAFYRVRTSGSGAPYGYDFGAGSLHRIYGTNTSTTGIRIATSNSSNVPTDRFQWSGFADSIRAAYSNTSKLILPPVVWVGNATDSAIITEPFIDSIRADLFGGAGGSVWTLSSGGDTLCMNDTSGTASLCWYWDGTYWVRGEEGTTIVDTLLITSKFYMVVNGGADTIFVDTSGVADNDILKYDLATKTLQFVAETGGSGSIDSLRIFDGTANTDLWTQAIRLAFGNGIQADGQAADSSGTDTLTFEIDTTTIATVGHAENYADTIVGDSLTAYFDTAQVVDTILSSLLDANIPNTITIDNATMADSAQNIDTTTATAVALQEKIADVAGGMVSGNTESGIAVTYDDADNTIDFMVQNVVSSMIAQQTILPADIDSTAQNFVFDDAYKATSGVSDSILITRRELDDSLDAVRSENAGLFQPIGHGDADSLKGVNIPNTPSGTGDDRKIMMFYDETTDSIGWSDTLDHYMDSATTMDSIIARTSSPTLNNVTVYGNLYATNYLTQWNHSVNFDLSKAWAFEGDTISLVDDSSGLDGKFLHPSVVYVPEGWNGYRLWMIVTEPLADGEEGFLFVTNTFDDDGNPSNFHRFIDSAGGVGSGDTLYNPLFNDDDYASTITDCNLNIGHDGKMWATVRIGRATDDSVFILAKSSSDGLTWTDPADTILKMYDPLGGGGGLGSPSFVYDTGGIYKMFIILNHVSVDSQRVVMYTADAMDGTWTFEDTTDMRSTNNTIRDMWNLSVVSYSPDYYLAVIHQPTLDDQTGGEMAFAESRDGGYTWSDARALFDEASGTSTVYRGDGYWFDYGSSVGFKCFYSERQAASDTTWKIKLTDVIFEDSALYNDYYLIWSDTAGATASRIANKGYVGANFVEIADSNSWYYTQDSLDVLLGNKIETGDTKNRTVILPVDRVHGRVGVPGGATDSVYLSFEIMDGINACLLKDSSVGASSFDYDTLYFSWDGMPENIVSVDSVIFTYKLSTATSTDITALHTVLPDRSSSSVMADSVGTTDYISSNLESTSWSRVAYYLNLSTSAVNEGEQLGLRMGLNMNAGANVWIGRMYLKCTVQYTY